MSTPSDATHEGRFSDGRTATVVPAAVRLTPQGVEITPTGRQGPLTWPYGELTAASSVSKGMSDVLLSHAATPGATLFVGDRAFVVALVAKAPHLTASRQRWRVALPLMAVCAAIVLIAVALWFADVSPTRAVARLLPADVRQSLGRQVVTSLGRGHRTCLTPDGSAALKRLTERLSAWTGSARFAVSVLDWDLVNAFAAPGEQIILTRALIEQANSPDEVAGVLAHEMGHGLELHPESSIIRAIGLSAAVDLMLGGSSGTLANIGILLAQLGYSRVAEREADAHAVRILRSASVASKGFGDFFERLEPKRVQSATGAKGESKSDRVGTRLLTIMSTHPATEERIAMVRSQPPYPATPALSDADWQALRQMCGPPRATPPSRRAPPGGDRDQQKGTPL
jgi:predicted Zn-dependent protease